LAFINLSLTVKCTLGVAKNNIHKVEMLMAEYRRVFIYFLRWMPKSTFCKHIREHFRTTSVQKMSN